MENQLTNNANALRLFFTDEVFVVKDESVKIVHPVQVETVREVSVNIPQTTTLKVETPVLNVPSLKPLEQQQVSPVIPQEPEKAVTTDFKFLGGNKKSVLILVNDQHNDVSTPEGRELLRKIVKAVDLATPDFALLNYAAYLGVDFTTLQQFFKPVIMLSFGVEIQSLNLRLSWQNEIIVHQNTRMIFAPNLHILDSDLPAKKLLWGNLQKIK